MLITYWLSLALAASLLTAAWLYKPEERTNVTALGAFLAWGLTALLGGDVTIFDESAGEMVSAPVPEEIRLFAALWAVLSGMALILYVTGVYPPDTDDPFIDNPSADDLR